MAHSTKVIATLDVNPLPICKFDTYSVHDISDPNIDKVVLVKDNIVLTCVDPDNDLVNIFDRSVDMGDRIALVLKGEMFHIRKSTGEAIDYPGPEGSRITWMLDATRMHNMLEIWTLDDKNYRVDLDTGKIIPFDTDQGKVEWLEPIALEQVY